ncbi:MAG TPA: hypothetical protein VHA52_12815, partial [Candidatus Babeliaceae bacterium]|nr:hypothetical protein [Candidatus Babeliaceae bacterium]
MGNEHELTFTLSNSYQSRCTATVQVSRNFVDQIYRYVLQKQCQDARTQGFSQGATPITYIENTFRIPIINHLKEFFFTHCVINFLCRELSRNKLVVIGGPLLKETYLVPQEDALFIFELNLVDSLAIRSDWKRLPFKCPERKNYKDLDRQVTTFIKEEHDRFLHGFPEGIEIGDWVEFSLSVLDAQGNALLGDHHDTLWLRVGEEEMDRDAQELFLGKKVGDCFAAKSPFLQKYISESL